MIIMDKISVIMSVYNEDKNMLSQAIESVLKQTYESIEFIIVLDNKDNKDALLLIRNYLKEDKRIKLIINDQNIGLTESLNRALSVCTGKYIARMDADDICILDRLEKQIKFMKSNEEIDFVAANAIIINEYNEEMYRTNNHGGNHKKCEKGLKYKNFFIHPTWMFKSTILDKIIKYNEVPRAEDYDFICRVVLNGYKVTIMDEYLIKYRIRENGITRSNLLHQYLMAKVIRKQYNKALKTKNFSLYNPYEYINTCIIKNDDKAKYTNACRLYDKGIVYAKQNNYLMSMIFIARSLLRSKYKFEELCNTIMLKLINKRS